MTPEKIGFEGGTFVLKAIHDKIGVHNTLVGRHGPTSVATLPLLHGAKLGCHSSWKSAEGIMLIVHLPPLRKQDIDKPQFFLEGLYNFFFA